jgi:hypothetical protein
MRLPAPWVRPAAAFSALLLASGCGGGSRPTLASPAVNGSVRSLVAGNPTGDDDDPTVALDAHGNIHVVFFSDRDGSKDLYEVHSTGFDLTTATVAWSPLTQITHNDPAQFPPPAQGDNFPSLFIDATGTHHLVWHRWNLANESHILYAKSDGTATGWAAAAIIDVTTGANFDRFPQVVKFADNDLRIYFGSSTRKTANKNDIFVTQSTDGGLTWAAPQALAQLNSTTEQSQFPHIFKLTGGTFMATFARWKLEPSMDALDTSSDIFFAQSADATTWTVEQVTSDPSDIKNDFTPAIFFDHTGAAHLEWTSIAFGDPAGDIVEMPVSARASFPSFVTTPAPASGIPDHSPQIAALAVSGRPVFVAIWVRITTAPHNQLVYRMFSTL